MIPLVHLIGPGGAGKTTVGPLLAQRLAWRFVDLDQVFIAQQGDVAAFMARHGYAGYAVRNIETYEQLRAAATAPTVLAMSSGFMTYPADVSERYPALRDAIEGDPLTALLLPSFELERCVERVVERQLGRPYLNGDRISETRRIRERHPVFMALRCERFLSEGEPLAIACDIEGFVRRRLPITRQDAPPIRRAPPATHPCPGCAPPAPRP